MSSKKRKAPESSELSASLAELIEDVKNNKSRVLEVRKGQWGVSDAIEKLTNLPLFSNNQLRNPPLFKDNNEKMKFFNWCIQLFRKSDKDVDIFCSLATVDQRTAWILSERQRVIDAFQAEQTRGLCPIGAWGFNYAIRKLRSLPVFSNPVENVNFLIWCMKLLGRSDKEVIVFCNLDTPKQRMAWLHIEYENHRMAWENANVQTRGPPLPPFPDYE